MGTKTDLRKLGIGITDTVQEYGAEKAFALVGLHPFQVEPEAGDTLPAPHQDRFGKDLRVGGGDAVYYLTNGAPVALGSPAMQPGRFDGQRVRLVARTATVTLPIGSVRDTGTATDVAPGADITLVWDSGAGLWSVGGGGGGGGGGGVTIFVWRFSTSTVAADPGSGRFRFDNAVPAAVTNIYIDSVTQGGLNLDNFLTALAGEVIGIQQADDPTKIIVVEIGTPVDNTGWWTLPVTQVIGAAGGLFTNNRDCAFIFPSGGAGPVAHAATTGQTPNDHHDEAHTIASHSDTTATGAELETLTGGNDADALHSHDLVPRTYSFLVENPVTNDDIPRIRMRRDFHVLRITALRVAGTGTFDWELRYSPNANDQGAGTLLESDTGVNNETTGVEYLAPFDPGDPAVIPADDWLWLELPAVSTGLARPVAAIVVVDGVEE